MIIYNIIFQFALINLQKNIFSGLLAPTTILRILYNSGGLSQVELKVSIYKSNSLGFHAISVGFHQRGSANKLRAICGPKTVPAQTPNVMSFSLFSLNFTSKALVVHSVVVSLWDVPEPLYIEILRSDRPQKRLADVDLTHLKSYWVIHTISIAALGHSMSLWAIYFVSSHPKSSWVNKTSYVRGPPIQNLIYCDSVVTTTTVCVIGI